MARSTTGAALVVHLAMITVRRGEDAGVDDESAQPFEPEGVTWTPVSPRLAAARRVVVLLVTSPIAAVAVVLALVLQNPIPLLAGLPWVMFGACALMLIPRQVRAWGYAERDEDLLVRKGVMFRSMVVVPYGRMQYVDVQAGPLDRRFGLATVQLHTASAGTDAAIPGLSPQEAARLRDRLASAGEARLTGL